MRLSIMLAIALSTASCVPMAANQTMSSRPTPSDDEAVPAFVRIMNRHRSQVGCGPLEWDDRVAEVARKHSEEMARFGYMSHTNRAGQSPFARLAAAGITYSGAAENVAAGQRTAQHVFDSWRNSPGHRQNIENCKYNRHGVAMINAYWTHVFITAR